MKNHDLGQRPALLLIAAALLLVPSACGVKSGGGDADTDVDSDSDTDTDTDSDTRPLPKITAGPYLLRPTADSVEIWWETDGEYTPAVAWSEDESLDRRATGETMTDDYSEAMWIAPPPGYRQRVILDGLQPGQRYSYRITSVEDPPAAASLLPAPSASEPTRLIVFGDTRTHDDLHTSVITAMVAESPDAVVNTGDLMNSGENFDNWTGFFAIEAELLHSVPLFPVMGNHEVMLDGWLVFTTYFGVNPDSGSSLHYSFDHGPVHGIVLNSNGDFESNTEQMTWLETDLQAVGQRAAAPAILVFFHHPLYTFSNHDPELEAREVLVPLFEVHGVDAVFWGHNHCYERFDVNGVPYITAGGGGAPLNGVGDPEGDDAALYVTGESTLHYIRLDVEPSRLDATVIRVPDGATIDSFSIESFD